MKVQDGKKGVRIMYIRMANGFESYTDADCVGSRPLVVMTSWIHTRGSSLFEYM